MLLIIDGTPKPLRLDFEALEYIREAESRMPRSFMEIVAFHNGMFKLQELILLCWAGWRRSEKRTFSLIDAQRRIDEVLRREGLIQGTTLVGAAVLAALQDGGLLAKPGADENGNGDRPQEPAAATATAPAPEPSPN